MVKSVEISADNRKKKKNDTIKPIKFKGGKRQKFEF